eukprot:CAMPEP_0118713478 /NCGR_PEP_ID=MMETSP0800-20121206/25538_1 /TAXON_ID=210618 ORGANISM="Striatella unipunctata, Strain CCMP2910" /NCGR_SAMPLE_ID=MMETSP0800 /ASSEMBLY_ACC=CAM_ASM_000638 /LENGTH=59 /DNA_ID=CAMNT_0006618933 /DNA_START=261 /DNA_END=440 /DNA_ORIENTATION=+
MAVLPSAACSNCSIISCMRRASLSDLNSDSASSKFRGSHELQLFPVARRKLVERSGPSS